MIECSNQQVTERKTSKQIQTTKDEEETTPNATIKAKRQQKPKIKQKIETKMYST